MASATKSQKLVEVGLGLIGGELNRRKSPAKKVRVVSQQCSEGKKEPANTFLTFLIPL